MGLLDRFKKKSGVKTGGGYGVRTKPVQIVPESRDEFRVIDPSKREGK